MLVWPTVIYAARIIDIGGDIIGCAACRVMVYHAYSFNVTLLVIIAVAISSSIKRHYENSVVYGGMKTVAGCKPRKHKA